MGCSAGGGLGVGRHASVGVAAVAVMRQVHEVIDVTDVPEAEIGDEVVLIGEQGGESLTAEQVAERLGTVNYEVVSEILARVPRVV